MLLKGYIVIFIEIYIYFRVMYLLENCQRLYFSMEENCHRLYFSIEESYVYYEFIRLY